MAANCGAYAIVEKDLDGTESVLEVFPVRDWEEQIPENSNKPPLVPDVDESVEKDKAQDADDLVIPNQTPKGSSADVSPTTQESEAAWIVGSDSPLLVSDATKSRVNSRFASVGLLFGSLWIVRESTKTEASSTDDVIMDIGSTGFSSRDRRNRRLHARLSK